MKRDTCDFSRIAPRHEEIHRRLCLWGPWIIDRPKPWRTTPMFRQYRSHAWQWHMPEIQIQGTPGENMIIEKAVSALPEKHAFVIRWSYVTPWVPVSIVRRELCATRQGVADLLTNSLDMLANRLKL